MPLRPVVFDPGDIMKGVSIRLSARVKEGDQYFHLADIHDVLSPNRFFVLL